MSSPGERDNAGVLAPPPLIYLAGLAAGLGLELLFHSPAIPRTPARVAGAVLVFAGMALILTFGATFGRAGTPIDPSKTPTTIVTTGPYRFTRNPAYLGFALVYVGTAVLFGALWALLTLVPTLIVVDRYVIQREERFLERKFGAQYLDYKSKVRRWI